LLQEEQLAKANSDQETAGSLTDLPEAKQREILLKFAREGKSDEEIGNEFGLSQWQVRNLRYRLGVKKSRRGDVFLVEPRSNAHGPAGAEFQGGSGAPGPLATRVENRGLTMTLEGTYESHELAKIVEGLVAFVSSSATQNKTYAVKLALWEMP